MANETDAPTIKNPELQDWYAEGRAKGYLAKNPAIHDWVAEGVKKGYLKDLSGASAYAPAPAPVDPTLSAQDAFATGADAPDPRDPYAKKGAKPRTQAARKTSDQSRYTDTYAPKGSVGRQVITPVYDDTQDAPKEAPLPAAVRRYAQTVFDAAAAAVTPNKDPRAPRGLGYPEMSVAGAVTAPVSNSVRNFTQGALAPGLARMGNRDTDQTTALTAIQDIFGDIPGNIKAGARAVLNDSGPQAVGRQVPELAPGTAAGDVLNTLTGIGSDPLNLLLAPTGANLPGVRALSSAGKEEGLAGIAAQFSEMMKGAGPNVVERAGQSARNAAYAGARKTAAVAGDAVYGRGAFAPDVVDGQVGSTSRIPRGAVKVEGEVITPTRPRAPRAGTEDPLAPPVSRGQMIEGKENVRANPNEQAATVPPPVSEAVSPPAEKPQGVSASVAGVSKSPASEMPATEQSISDTGVRKVSGPDASGKADGGVGSEGITYTPDDNTPVPYRWRVVDADTLKPSQTDTGADAPGYPQEIQPRDRDRTASKEQVAKIAQTLNPARLGDAPTTADGAPVVGADGFVESGNGRTLGIQRAYNQHPAQAAAYKESVLAQAQALGIDPAEIARMAKPVLIRERTGELDLPARAALAKKMGASTVAGMSETETAKTDGERLRNHPALRQYAQGAEILSPANNDFRRSFLDMLPQGERAGMMQSDGTMSAAGVRRVRNALLASAYDDTHALTRLTEATDDNIKRVGQAMEATAPAVARARNLVKTNGADPAFDITGQIARAANTLSNLRAQNVTVAGHLSQGALFGGELEPIEAELLRLFDDHKNRGKVITDTLAQYAHGWEIAGPSDQASMFGEDRPDAHALLRAARIYAEEKNGTQSTKTAQTADLFQTDNSRTPAAEGTEPAKGGSRAPDATDGTPAPAQARPETKPVTPAADPAPAAPKKRIVKKTEGKAQNSTPATLTEGEGTTLRGSVFGLGEFVEQDVLPAIGKLLEAGKELRGIFDPVLANPQAGQAARIVRANAGAKARSGVQAEEALKGASRAFDKLPTRANHDFIAAMEAGTPQAEPKLQAVADTMRALMDAAADDVRALGPGHLDSVIDNYFPHIWKDPQKAEMVLAGITAKKPLAGSASFKKQRTIATVADGLAAGLELASDNPVDLVLLKIGEMRRYEMFVKIKEEYKAAGLLKHFGEGMYETGWEKINDPGFSVTEYRQTTRKDGSPGSPEIIRRGTWQAPEAVARILNNYLSPGLSRSPSFQVARYAGNLMNMAQLGLSGFHFTFTAMDASISKAALGIEQIARGKVGAGLVNVAKGNLLYAPWENLIRGNKILQEYRTPGSQTGEIAEIVDALMAGGGRVQMDSFFRLSGKASDVPHSAADAFFKAYSKGNIPGALGRLMPAVVETTAKPLMDYVVPRQKMGIFADMARAELERLGPNASRDEVRRAMAGVWDSVDNRMGQLVYDNLFWNKALKDGLLVSVRSVGWNVGTLREIGGGVYDAATIVGRVRRGDPAVTRRMAYVLALPLVAGLMGGIANYLYTGERPKETLDYFYPRTGGIKPDGKPERVSLPSYIKDVVEYKHDPLKTVSNKTNPILSTLADMFDNQDYYGNQIRNPDDPLTEQAKQVAQFVGTQFLPFSARNQIERKKAGDTGPLPAVQSFLGVLPAPARIGRSAAENLITELMAGKMQKGARTPDARKRVEVSRDLGQSLRVIQQQTGKATPERSAAVREAMAKARAGGATDRMMDESYERSARAPILAGFKRLTLPESVKVWEVATGEERKLLRESMGDKVDRYFDLHNDKVLYERVRDLPGLFRTTRRK